MTKDLCYICGKEVNELSAIRHGGGRIGRDLKGWYHGWCKAKKLKETKE